MKTWRDLLYVATLSLTCAGVTTGVVWAGVALIKNGWTWTAVFLWLTVAFWLHEVSTNE